MNVLDLATGWHEGSDHGRDGEPFGGPVCNCLAVARRVMPLLVEAWENGYADRVEVEIMAPAIGQDPPGNPYSLDEGDHP